MGVFTLKQFRSVYQAGWVTDLLPPAKEVCEGYVFTGVCLSTWRVSAPLHAGIHTLPRTDTPWADTPLPQCMLGYGQQAGGTHPTGMYSCLYCNSILHNKKLSVRILVIGFSLQKKKT